MIVWVPGWTGATTTDDYVARWVPSIPGSYDLVAIEPAAGFGHDGATEIDAIKAISGIIPEPSAPLLFGFGIIAFAMQRRGKMR